MAQQIQLRRDTTANWTAEDPVVAAGEFAVTIDAGVVVGFKVGDGTSTWTELDYFTGGGEVDSVNGQTGVVVLDAADVGAATAADITAAVNAVIDSAPGALDTLNELAAALGDDAAFSTTVTNALAAKADTASLADVATSGDAADVAIADAGAYFTGTDVEAALQELGANSGASTGVDQLWIPANSMMLSANSPSLSQLNSSTPRTPVWLLDAALTETVSCAAVIPSAWTSTDVELYWANAGAGAGNVRWQIDLSIAAIGGNLVTGGAATALLTAAAGAQNVLVRSEIATGVAADAGDMLSLRIYRVGGDAADTLANDAGLIGVRLTDGAVNPT